MSAFGDVGADRVVTAANGTKIYVRQNALSLWPGWGAFWECNGARFCAPVHGDAPVPWDHEPTDAEVLTEYFTWHADKDLL